MRPVPGAPGSGSGGISGALTNVALLAGLLGAAAAQAAKVFTGSRAPGGGFDWSLALSAGGMPSSHTALVVALAMAIGVEDGTGSSVFALAVVVAAIVAYDASGVRLHAGRAAAAVNQLLSELPDGHSLAGAPLLRDRLGHEPEEVAAGAAVGAVAGLLVAFLFGGGGGGGGGGSGSGPAALSPSPGPLL